MHCALSLTHCASIILINIGNTEAEGSGKDGPWKDDDHVLRTVYGIVQVHGPDRALELVTTVHPDGTVCHTYTSRARHIHD